jgi:hypothetical protein
MLTNQVNHGGGSMKSVARMSGKETVEQTSAKPHPTFPSFP